MKKLLITLMLVMPLYSFAVKTTKLNDPLFLSQKFSLKEESKNSKVFIYFQKLFPSTKIDKIFNTPFKNTYSILAGQNIFIGQMGTPFIIVGHIFNPYTQQDVTNEIDEIRQINTKIDFSSIDISTAIVSKGKINPTGKKIIVFEDPDCPYCRMFEQQMKRNGLLDKLDVYRILIPLPMHPNSKDHMMNTYCSKDGNSLDILHKYMIDGDDNLMVKRKDGCNITAIIQKDADMMKEFDVHGTPTIILGNGKIVQGSDLSAIQQYVNGYKLPNINSVDASKPDLNKKEDEDED